MVHQTYEQAVQFTVSIPDARIQEFCDCMRNEFAGRVIPQECGVIHRVVRHEHADK